MSAPFTSATSGWSKGPGFCATTFGVLNFDGTDDYVDCAKLGLAGIQGAAAARGITVAAWVKPLTGIGTNAGIFHEWDGSSGPILFLSGTGTNIAWQFGTSSQRFTVNSVVTLNAWNHIVLTAFPLPGNGTNTRFVYINGAQVGSSTTTDTNNTINTTSAKIGHNAGGLSFFKGPIDAVLLYRRMLSGADVALLYQESLAGFPTLLRRLGRQAMLLGGAGGGASTIFSRRTFGPRVGRRQVV
jgi:hypothetical protein